LLSLKLKIRDLDFISTARARHKQWNLGSKETSCKNCAGVIRASGENFSTEKKKYAKETMKQVLKCDFVWESITKISNRGKS